MAKLGAQDASVGSEGEGLYTETSKNYRTNRDCEGFSHCEIFILSLFTVQYRVLRTSIEKEETPVNANAPTQKVIKK